MGEHASHVKQESRGHGGRRGGPGSILRSYRRARMRHARRPVRPDEVAMDDEDWEKLPPYEGDQWWDDVDPLWERRIYAQRWRPDEKETEDELPPDGEDRGVDRGGH